ncbi:ankyrin repeat domain-containing protein [Undibacterium sp.]|uniref:ankyrin repeat domain-containing protein n=1 Tax=Undibacterium sp. TaxID=1914977 RepID=UPI00374DBD39
MDMDKKQLGIAIRTAIKQDDLSQVAALIDNNKETLHMDTPFGTWLHVASSMGKFDIVKYLVSSGADVNKNAGTFNADAIRQAASAGHIDIVRYLLTHGSKLDTSEPEKNPLFASIYGGHLDIVRLLIAEGIDYHIKYTGESMKNMDALAFAVERGQTEIANYLLSLVP